MHFTSLLPLALSASAFLVPADIKGPVEVVDAIPAHALKEEIYLVCENGCPAASSSDGLHIKWAQNEESILWAELAVNDNKVTYNGHQIWPTTESPPLTIKQYIDDNNRGLELPISTSLEYKPDEILVDDRSHMTIHPITIDILAIGDKVVHVGTQEIRIADTKAGLALLPSNVIPYTPSPYTDSCTTVWCRVTGTIAQKFNQWRQAASRKIKGWKGCAGGKGRHGMPNVKGGPAKFGPGSTLRPEGGFRNQHHGGHHGHHHTLGHRILRTFRSAMTAALSGFAVGMFFLAVLHIIRARRAVQGPDYIVVEQVEIEEGRASMDGPPKYEEVYREPQIASEDEKKELLQ